MALAGTFVTFLLFFRYLIPLLSILVGPESETTASKWNSSLLKSLADLMADPSDSEIQTVSSEIRKSGLNSKEIRLIFDGPLSMVCAYKWQRDSFAFRDLDEFSAEYIYQALIRYYRACTIVRRTPIWWFYKFMMPAKVRSAFKEALNAAYSSDLNYDVLYR